MRLPVFLLLPLALYAASAHAIRINDHAFVAHGGDVANIDGTAANVFDALRNASHHTDFKAVGRLGDCTATALGAEGDHVWLVTAASCVPNTQLMQAVDDLVFTDFRGTASAGGPGGLSFIHPNRLHRPNGVHDAGTDIALVRLKRLSGPESPYSVVRVNDVEPEVGAPVHFVSHGVPGYGIGGTSGRSIGALWPVVGERRVVGASVVDGIVEDGHALQAGFAMGSPTRWAALGESDAGAPWIRMRPDLVGERSILFGTSSGGATVQSNAARASKYATWIKGLFPGTALLSQARIGPLATSWTIVNTPFRSTPFDPDVFFAVTPGQPWVSSGAEYDTMGIKGHTWLRVVVTEAWTGRQSEVEFRARREACRLPIDTRARCGTEAKLEVGLAWTHQLPAGRWEGRLAIDAIHPTTGYLETIDVPITFAVYNTEGHAVSVQRTPKRSFHQAYRTGSGTSAIYFTVPPQPGNPEGPGSGYVNHAQGHTRLTLHAREAVTQATVPITLRAARKNGCGQFPMNNAVVCPGGLPINWLHVWYDPADNTALAPGRYQASIQLLGRSWRDSNYSTNAPIDIDINLLP